ncbi:9223_t:CDS:2 [Paraglomus occultum]|uniref:protein disulfide-isomerase n=1 Tax=Paraglomus occultum TaxID=144539 RepID=A0A9N9CE27_9GLOM|nr:9223_t:CDS:2 [Paraglomus occultum]
MNEQHIVDFFACNTSHWNITLSNKAVAMRDQLTLIVLILAILFRHTSAFYDKDGPVIVLNEKNFKDEVISTEKLVLVEFYAPWCPHCQRLTQDYKKAADNLKGLVKVGAVDCDEDANRGLCQAFEVKGYPTIKLFPSNRVPDKRNPGAYTKKPKSYNGERTAKAFVDYVLAELPSYVQPISNKHPTKKSLTIDEVLEKDNLTVSKVILFTNKDRTTPLYKVLSADYRDGLFGEVRQKETEIALRFNVTTFPTLLVIPKGETEPIKYEGKYNHESLSNFLNKYVSTGGKPGETKSEKKSTTTSSSKPEPFYPKIDEIKTEDDLTKYCLSHNTGICVFTFLPLEPEYPESVAEFSNAKEILSKVNENLYNLLKNQVPLRFIWFNALADESKKLIKDFKLADVFPVLMAYSPHKKIYSPYLGPFDNEGIEKFLKDVLNGKGNSYKIGFEVSFAREPNKKNDVSGSEKKSDKETDKNKERQHEEL